MRGKGSDTQYHHRGARDHPRLCGEKHEEKFQNHVTIGSPPPMRGKVFPSDPIQKFIGITPAYAGKRLIHGGR